MNRDNRQNIEIRFYSGKSLLHGMLHLPDSLLLSSLPPLVVGSHGFEGSMESAKQQLLSKILPQNGFAFLRFSHRGCKKSEGDFVKDTSIAKRVEDLISAVDNALKLQLTKKRQIFLFGSSLGGSTVIATWQSLADKGLSPLGAILCAAPVNSMTIQRIPLNGNDLHPPLPISFFEKNLLFDLTDRLANLSNILIFHGDQDKTVPIENGYTIYKHVKEPKELIILKDGDHQMSNKKDQELFKVEALKWLKKTINQD
ncbi:MAG: alpha/beta hydrolase [Desulfamplus sp.]|nr:alpha/beta hydrolase [Desulfamplus sp.]